MLNRGQMRAEMDNDEIVVCNDLVELLGILQNAAAERTFIRLLVIKGHGGEGVITLGRTGLCCGDLPAGPDEGPRYSINLFPVDGGGAADITELFSAAIGFGTCIYLNACATARGERNLARMLSRALSGAVVIGGTGRFQLGIPGLQWAIGADAAYMIGVEIERGWNMGRGWRRRIGLTDTGRTGHNRGGDPAPAASTSRETGS